MKYVIQCAPRTNNGSCLQLRTAYGSFLNDVAASVISKIAEGKK